MLGALALGGLLASCGARSPLLPGQESCGVDGQTQECSDACGLGTQVCSAGYWGACVVTPTSRPCSDACGSGSQACANGKWGSCEVPNATRGCSNDCGSGVERCSASTWGSCEVPVVTMQCADLCGVGTRSCESGSWGACVGPVVVEQCESVCGSGKRICQDGALGDCDAPQPKPPQLQATIRDFKDTHPDMERPIGMGVGMDRGIVETLLGADGTPVYASAGVTLTTSGRAAFDQWYHDVPGVNLSTPYQIQMQVSSTKPGIFVFDNPNFFPIDNKLFGNQGRPHNYHFTLQTQFNFRYIGGEVFRFRGDDDLWVFINGRLAIDLGGLHESLSGEALLDDHAAELGLVRGNVYPLNLFFAERHTVSSNFSIETSIADPGTCE